MAIQVGEKIPDVTIKTMQDGGMQDVSTAELCAGKKVVLFAVPGAFTPTCSMQHLPGFIEKADDIRAKGVDTIACLSVNDAFVMDAWGKDRGAGDKVLMWYVSGNRDPEVFENPDALDIERPNVRNHLSFGFGIHRCMGNRLAELQLRILWEEILVRFDKIKVMDEPSRTFSSFVKGYTHLPVQVFDK